MLEIIDLTQSLDKATYRAELDRYQTWMRMLGYHLHYQQRPAVIVFEGWDAAGKGGAINRLTERLEPCGMTAGMQHGMRLRQIGMCQVDIRAGVRADPHLRPVDGYGRLTGSV